MSEKRKAGQRRTQLMPRQQAFIREYLVDLDGKHAAIRAGYSKKTAEAIASHMLGRPNIVAAVKKAMDARAKRTEITQDRVLKELAAIAFADTTKAIVVENGRVRVIDTNELERDTRVAIASISNSVSKEGRSLGIKFHDKKGALELLGKHLGMFVDKFKGEHTVRVLFGEDPEPEGE